MIATGGSTTLEVVTESIQRKRGRGSDTERTRQELVDAAFDVLLNEGYRGASARAIANKAGQNQRAIYYHFDGIENLLVEALARSSERRLERYRAELDGVEDLGLLLSRLQDLYRADVASGHNTVMAELMGGISAAPELRDGINSSIAPWIDFVRGKVEQVAATHPYGSAVPSEEITDLIFSLFIGIEMHNRLDDSTTRADRLFNLAHLANLLWPSAGPPPTDQT